MTTRNSGSFLVRLQQAALWIEDALLVLILTLMILLAAGQILLRNLFDTGFSWGDPTLRVLVLWVALLGAMAATRDVHHIRIDLLSRYLPAGIRRINQRVTDLFAGAVCSLLAWHSGRFVFFEWQDGSILFAAVPAWVCELILPLGFGVMALRFVLRGLTGRHEENNP